MHSLIWAAWNRMLTGMELNCNMFKNLTCKNWLTTQMELNDDMESAWPHFPFYTILAIFLSWYILRNKKQLLNSSLDKSDEIPSPILKSPWLCLIWNSNVDTLNRSYWIEKFCTFIGSKVIRFTLNTRRFILFFFNSGIIIALKCYGERWNKLSLVWRNLQL